MRVLHVQKVKGIGGSERHLLSLLPGLQGAGDQVRLLVLAAGADEPRFLRMARAAEIDVVAGEAGHHLDLRSARTIAREIRRFRPDLVHTHLIHADLWGQMAARSARVPGVRTLHNATPRAGRGAGLRAGRLAGRLAVRTVAISHHVAAFAERARLAPTSRIRVVPYGIDADAWVVEPGCRAACRAELGLGDTDVAVGMAARLIEGKGHALAFEGLRRAARDIPSLRLVVAGEGPLRAELRRRAAELPADTVTFAGQVDDMAGFFGACDLVVFPTMPSLGEGFGLSALEAAATGRAVVATRVGALPEVVEDGVTGLVTAPDARALAAALGVLGSDPGRRAAMGAAGRERAADRFSLDDMVRRTRGVYEEAMEERV